MAFLTLALLAAATDVQLVTFTGDKATAHTFQELNDPVMGGQSVGTWSVDNAKHFGIFNGTVKNVPSLKAPGFIKASTTGKFPDASSAVDGHLVLEVRTTTAAYTGFRVTFAAGALNPSFACAGGGGIPLSRGCYKSHFEIPKSGDFSKVMVPMKSFSDKWSSATGNQTVTCADDKSVCPTAKGLAKIQSIEIWAEGVDGSVHVELKSISVTSD